MSPQSATPTSPNATVLDWAAPFDDLEVGLAFTTRARTITEADVVAFASLTGDWHPQHTDAVWAGQSMFGERIAHGLLVISYAAGRVPFDPERVLALRRITDVVFKRPVLFGDTLTVKGRISDLQPISEEAGLVTFAWNVVNQDNKTVCRAKVEVMWATDSAITTR